jgi:hypothetical protein
VEAWSNTSTVALRVVGGDEKGTLYLGDTNFIKMGSVIQKWIGNGYTYRNTDIKVIS